MRSLFQILLLGAVVVFGAIFTGESLLSDTSAQSTLFGQDPVDLVDLGIIGPSSVVVGELARLEVTGDKVKWDCIPHILDGQSYGENSRYHVCSFREPGTYNIIAAVYVNEEVEILHLPITVEGPVGPAPPYVPEPVTIINYELVREVATWCQGANKGKVRDIASVFVTVAADIERGVLVTTGEIVNRTAVLTQKINLSGLNSLMNKIQNYLTTRADSGELSTLQEHLSVWLSIAQGLDQYAGG